MTIARNELRNRKSGESWVGLNANLSKQSVFNKTQDVSHIEAALQDFINNLPDPISTRDKEQILFRLRKEYISKNKDIDTIIHNPQAFMKLIDNCVRYQATNYYQTDALTTTGFLKLLGAQFVNAQFSTVFPLIALMAAQIAPVTAFNYTYHIGQPQGGEDLCANFFDRCIQGYLTEIGQLWKKDLPQVARIVDSEVAGVNHCVAQPELKTMLKRAYRGPNEYATNCTVNANTANAVKVSVQAKNIDPITCDIMQDSLIGLTQDCSKLTSSSSSKILLAAASVGGGITLAILAFGLYKAIKHRREQELVSNPEENSVKYGSMV